MLPQRDLWIAHRHGEAACEHPENTIQMVTKVEGLAEEPG